MATVQLVDVREGIAAVQRDDLPPVELTWALLHEAQQQHGPAGYVYRWLMQEYCRCEYQARQGQPWTSPRREVAEIVASLQAEDSRPERKGETTNRRKA